MANSIYFRNCLGAIRHTVYGRDNRKPIADAIESADKFNRDHIQKYAELVIQEGKDKRDSAKAECNAMKPQLSELEKTLPKSIGSIIADPDKKWYTYDYVNVNFESIKNSKDQLAIIETEELFVEEISGIEYCFVDSISGDNVINIENEDYLLSVKNPIAHIYPHYGEGYTLIISRINGQ